MFLDCQVWETPVAQVQRRMELAMKELGREKDREKARQFITTRDKRSQQHSAQMETWELGRLWPPVRRTKRNSTQLEVSS